jgi:5-formyltetrahydrofolate cyclo-ligase
MGKPDVVTEAFFKQKATVRKEILEKRKSQDPKIRAAQSRSIMRTLLSHKEFQKADRILIYLSKDGEVGTDNLLGRAFELGKRVCVPVVDRENDELRISELPGPDTSFQLGAFGVREPAEEDLNFVPPDQIDLVVTPGLAFDRRGGRIGYGKGYYDRLLSRLGSQVPRIALAFDFQVLDTVPQNKNDIRVDAIITEKSTMNCSGI